MREMAYLEIAERLQKLCKMHVVNIQDRLKPYLFQYFLRHLTVTIISQIENDLQETLREEKNSQSCFSKTIERL